MSEIFPFAKVAFKIYHTIIVFDRIVIVACSTCHLVHMHQRPMVVSSCVCVSFHSVYFSSFCVSEFL